MLYLLAPLKYNANIFQLFLERLLAFEREAWRQENSIMKTEGGNERKEETSGGSETE